MSSGSLDVPMFFLVRGGEYRPANGITFRRFLESGLDGERATLGDWERHLTTVFPEVRLKKVLEMRGADAVPRGLTCSLPALWKGLLYDAQSRAEAWERVRIHPLAAREAARVDVARRGLAARYGDEPVLELARDLAQLARDGLRRLAARRPARSPTRPASSIRCSSSSSWARARARWCSSAGRETGTARWIV